MFIRTKFYINRLTQTYFTAFLARLYESTGRAIAVTPASASALALASALLKMLKFLVKVFMSLYLLKLWMDQVDTLHVGRYWSEVLCCTIMTHLGDLEVKVTDLENVLLMFLVKVFVSLYLLKLLMDQVDTLHVGRYWSDVLFCTIMTHLGDLEVKVTDLENVLLMFLVKVFIKSICLGYVDGSG